MGVEKNCIFTRHFFIYQPICFIFGMEVEPGWAYRATRDFCSPAPGVAPGVENVVLEQRFCTTPWASNREKNTVWRKKSRVSTPTSRFSSRHLKKSSPGVLGRRSNVPWCTILTFFAPFGDPVKLPSRPLGSKLTFIMHVSTPVSHPVENYTQGSNPRHVTAPQKSGQALPHWFTRPFFARVRVDVAL